MSVRKCINHRAQWVGEEVVEQFLRVLPVQFGNRSSWD